MKLVFVEEEMFSLEENIEKFKGHCLGRCEKSVQISHVNFLI